MPTANAYLALLVAVAVERVAELGLSARNARRAFARGGKESGRALYPWMVAFHAGFLAALALATLRDPAPRPLAWAPVAGVVLAQGLRWWAVASLGDRWNTRVIVVPGESPVTRGPYAFLRHPNYLAVVLEVACLPLAFGLWKLALAFSAGNALLLGARIRDEERALGPDWEKAFSGKGRLVP
jgi:methyltransferase